VDGSVKVEDAVVLCDVGECSELTDDVSFVLLEFVRSVGICEEHGTSGASERDSPLPVSLDRFGGSQASASSVKGDINVSDRLSVAVIRFEGIVPRIDFVEIDEPSEEDVVPKAVRENGASRVANDFILCCFDVHEVVSFKPERKFDSRVGGVVRIREASPHEEGFVGLFLTASRFL
jgi:hypothetical protein